MAVAVLAGSVLLAANIESVVSVSPGLVEDLQLMILLAFFNCALSLVVVVFGIAAFIKNQLYLNSIAQLVSSVIRAMLLCVLFLTLVHICGITAQLQLSHRSHSSHCRFGLRDVLLQNTG